MMRKLLLATCYSSRIFRGSAIALQSGLLALIYAPPAFAAITLNDPRDINTKILCPIAAYMFWTLIGVSTIMVLVAAFTYLTAGGEAEKVGKAHKTLLYAAAGIIVALIAKGFPAVIGSLVGESVSGCP